MEEFLRKAEESLAGAEAELAAGRYNNCANRAYYACFQAAVYALWRAGVSIPADGRAWGHAFVQAEFSARLVNRRKLYPNEFKDTLTRLRDLRDTADYATTLITVTQAARAVHRAREYVAAVRSRQGNRQ